MVPILIQEGLSRRSIFGFIVHCMVKGNERLDMFVKEALDCREMKEIKYV